MTAFKPKRTQPDNVTDRGKVERVRTSGAGDSTETLEWIDVATQAELDAHTADATAAHAASAISFSATGTIASTDAQAAIAEVATDAATALSTHAADATAVHGITDSASLVYWANSTAEADAFPSGTLVLVLDPAVDPDTTPPSTPTNLLAVAGDTIADLSWTASTDNVAVAGYRIYRDTVLVDTISAITTYQATGLTNGVEYAFTVSAIDTSSNESVQSSPATVTPNATTFSPDDLSGLVVWFDADNAGVADGAAMSSWADQSGNARNLAQASGTLQPTYDADGINGHPAVYFDGSASMATSAFTSVPSPHTLFAVHKLDSIGTLRYSVDGIAAGGRLGLFRNSGGTSVLGFTGGVAISGTVTSTTSAELVTVVHNGASSSMQKNNETADTGDAGTHSITGINVGSRYGGTVSPWLGHIGAVLVYSRVLTPTEIAQVKTFLNDKFDVY